MVISGNERSLNAKPNNKNITFIRGCYQLGLVGKRNWAGVQEIQI